MKPVIKQTKSMWKTSRHDTVGQSLYELAVAVQRLADLALDKSASAGEVARAIGTDAHLFLEDWTTDESEAKSVVSRMVVRP